MLFEKKTTFTDESFGSFGANSHALDVGGDDISGDHQYIYPLTTSDRVKRSKIQGPQKFTGSISVPLFPVGAASLVYYALGTVTTTLGTPNTDVNQHVITKAKTIPFFRAEFGRDVKAHRYVGGIVNTMTLDYNPAELLMASFDVVFRKELSMGTLSSVTFPEFNSVERPLGGTEVSATFGGSSATFVESMSITCENNVEEDSFALGSKYLPAGIIAMLDVTGSMDLRYDVETRYQDWLDGTDKQVVLEGSYGSGEAYRKIKVDLPDIAYDTNNLPVDNYERLVQTIDFTAQRDSNGDPILVTIVNEKTNAQFTG